MKKLLIITTLTFISLGAFAQGKVSLSTDSLHLAYWMGGPFNGMGVNSDRMDPAIAAVGGLSVDLYLGTSSSQLYLYSSATFGTVQAGEGKWTSVSVQAQANATTGAPLILGNTMVFAEVQIRDLGHSAPNIFIGNSAGFAAYGKSAEFTFTLGNSITYPPLWSQTVGTWPTGTFNMDNSSYGTGARGAIAVVVPEPSTFALAGLGAVAMLIFRRRK